MILPSERIEKVLDLIYDAAAENDLWRDVLTAIADLTNSQGGILFGFSFLKQAVYFDYNGRLNEECKQAFQERHLMNPWAIYMEKQPVGRLVMSDEIMELDNLQRTPFYDEVLRPQEVGHSALMAIARKEDFAAAFNLCRTLRQGPLKAEELRLLEWLSPHMGRSAALGFRIDGYRSLRDAAFEVLDRLFDGVAILDRKARILFANETVRALETEGMLRLRPTVALASSSHSPRLTAIIKAAISGAPGGIMSIPRNADGHLLTLTVSSIRGKDLGRMSDAGFKDAAVFLFVVDPANRRSISSEQIMDGYKLTQAEARVALAVSSGLNVSEAGRLLNLSPNTIKTHLRRIYAKTATESQVELAMLMTAVGTLRPPAEA